MEEKEYIQEMVKLLILQKDLTWKAMQGKKIKDFYSMKEKIAKEFDRQVRSH